MIRYKEDVIRKIKEIDATIAVEITKRNITDIGKIPLILLGGSAVLPSRVMSPARLQMVSFVLKRGQLTQWQSSWFLTRRLKVQVLYCPP